MRTAKAALGIFKLTTDIYIMYFLLLNLLINQELTGKQHFVLSRTRLSGGSLACVTKDDREYGHASYICNVLNINGTQRWSWFDTIISAMPPTSSLGAKFRLVVPVPRHPITLFARRPEGLR